MVEKPYCIYPEILTSGGFESSD